MFKKANALVPTWVAFSVITLMEENLGSLVDYQFTAQMEDDLDAISRGERGHVEYLDNFYFGNGRPGLKKLLEHKIDEIDPAKISRIFIGKPDEWSRGLRPSGSLLALCRARRSDGIAQRRHGSRRSDARSRVAFAGSGRKG